MSRSTRRSPDTSGLAAVRHDIVAASFQGPLPPPDMLEQYNAIVPDAAERILAMAEKNGEHRRTLEAFAVKAEHTRSMGGLIVGGVVALAIVVGAVIVTLDGHPEVGVLMVGIDIAGIVGSLVYGTESRRRERQKRAEIMTGRR